MPLAWPLLLVLTGAALTGAEPLVWTTDALVKIRPDSLPPLGTQAITLDLCRGETGSLQIAVRAAEQGLARAVILPFALRLGGHRIRVESAAIFRQHHVQIAVPSGNADRTPGAWPDALIPQPYVRDHAVPAGRTAAWWVDLAVPPDAPPGRYTGDATLLLDGAPHPVALAVRVVDVTLPVERHVRANVAMYWDDVLLDYANRHWRAGQTPWTTRHPEYEAIKNACYELLLDHRLCAYDLPAPASTPAGSRWLTDPRVHSVRLPWMDDQGSAALLATVAAADRLGVRDKLYYYAADEPQPAQYASVREAAADLHQLAPGVPFVATVAPVSELFGAVDTWCPNLGNFMGLGYLDPDQLAARRRVGEATWWYTCCVPLHPYPTWLVDDDAVAPRASLWAMARYGWTGFVYSMGHGWSPDPYASVASFNATNGDGLLLYPGQAYGTRQPFASLRLKLLRDGLQDYELLRLLGESLDAAARRHGTRGSWGRAAVTHLAAQVVDQPYRLDRDPGALPRLRQTAVELLRAARRDDLLLDYRRGPTGAVLAGRLRPGTPLRIDRQPVTVAPDGAWQTATAPSARTATIEVGEPPLTIRWPLRPALPTPRAPFLTVSPVRDAALDRADWSDLAGVVLDQGVTIRFGTDAQALWVVGHGAEQVTVVLDPGRRHDTAYTFSFNAAPQRAYRRTATGRDPGYAPEWQAAAHGDWLVAAIPWAALGGPPRPGDTWGATALGYTATGRTFWHDHHGDLRALPELRF